jgi:hypothetical protein
MPASRVRTSLQQQQQQAAGSSGAQLCAVTLLAGAAAGRGRLVETLSAAACCAAHCYHHHQHGNPPGCLGAPPLPQRLHYAVCLTRAASPAPEPQCCHADLYQQPDATLPVATQSTAVELLRAINAPLHPPTFTTTRLTRLTTTRLTRLTTTREEQTPSHLHLRPSAAMRARASC